MPLSVAIDSVTLAGDQGVRVSGTGSPNGANVTVSVQITGDGNGNGGAVVDATGHWSVTVMIQNVHAGQSGKATATLTSGGQSTQGSKDFTL